MLSPDDRVLVAVSGGKDSLAVWDILIDLGYRADGLYLGLGIGDYSDESAGYARRFADERGLILAHARPSQTSTGTTCRPPPRSTHRVPCSACGLSKRHLFDEAAREGGYDVVVTGHNLDDEAAVLFGNTLRWDVEYLARQLPVLPARDGFPKKAKPLVRLTEREMAAWCIVRGIDYQVEECPMAAGNKHLAYKAALNAIERDSPGSKAAFYLNFVERMAPLLAGADAGGAPAVCARARCAARRRRARSARSAGSRSGSQVAPSVPVEVCSAARSGARATRRCGVKPLDFGDRVMLLDAKKRRYLITLAVGGEFHSHAGFVPHDDDRRPEEGSVVRSTRAPSTRCCGRRSRTT